MDEIISSLTNAKVKYVGRLQTDRRFREQEHHFVVEGSRWLAELIAHDVTPHTIFCTAAWAGVAENGRLLAQVAVSPLLAVTDPVMRRMSDTQTPPGVLAVAPMPDLALAVAAGDGFDFRSGWQPRQPGDDAADGGRCRGLWGSPGAGLRGCL
jgi:RNA methyltransferase, TrmH family